LKCTILSVNDIDILKNPFIFQTSFCTESQLHGKNDFAKGSQILLDTNLKIILLDHQNNFDKNLKNNEQCCTKF